VWGKAPLLHLRAEKATDKIWRVTIHTQASEALLRD